MKITCYPQSAFQAILAVGVACLILGDAISSAAEATTAPPNLTPALSEVLKLSQAHLADDVILGYIKNSGAAYSLSANDILYLNSQGVSQPVISALLQNGSSAIERRRQRLPRQHWCHRRSRPPSRQFLACGCNASALRSGCFRSANGCESGILPIQTGSLWIMG